MAPKPSKGKGVASASHGSKRSKRASEEEHDDVEWRLEQRGAPVMLRKEWRDTPYLFRLPNSAISIQLGTEAAKSNSNPRRNNEDFIYYYKYPLFLCLRCAKENIT
ncbi:hypothetical protein HAX54_045476 [Datura stramonium]|uniref:Uncharacterized protein n=1 Tax=Datura stramonium TaxID=4076 RepID=A0ABS8WJH3_DATST|nr:hypothetical protein [Datura stramonium]